MRNIKYIGLFLVIQTIALVLAVIGLPICFVCAYILPGRVVKSPITRLPMLTFPSWAWLWANDEDGVYPMWYARINPTWSMSRVSFVWTALRNPVNNFRFVPGVSKAGRPLWYWSNGKHYAKAGWESNGYPSLSFGTGKGY